MLTIAPPTPRELFILTALFVLLYVFNTVQTPELIVEALTDTTALLTGPKPLHADAHLVWGTHAVPNTKIVAHVPGWTVFDKLYVHRGIPYIVTDSPTTIPALHFIYSKGHKILPGHIGETERMPTDDDIRVISTKEAQKLFGTSAQLIDGVTVCVPCRDLTACSLIVPAIGQRSASIVRALLMCWQTVDNFLALRTITIGQPNCSLASGAHIHHSTRILLRTAGRHSLHFVAYGSTVSTVPTGGTTQP